MLRDETRDCLELLVEMRLALSSPITVEARVVTVVSVSSSVVSASDVVDAPPPLSLLLPQEMIVRLKMDMRIMYKTFFIFFHHK